MSHFSVTISIAVLAVASIATSAVCHAQQSLPPGVKTDESRVRNVVVIRFHRQLFEGLVNRTVERSVPVRTCVLDAYCVGTADVTATTSLGFDGGTAEQIPIDVSGVIHARAAGYMGPFVSNARSQLSFTGRFTVGFDGEKFSALPGHVSARSCSTVDRVRTRRGRIGSRLISRIGLKMSPRITPKYDAAGGKIAEREILTEADEMLAKLVGQLNDVMEIEKTIIEIGAKQGYERTVAKTNKYIQARIAPIGMPGPLPPEDDDLADAPVEIWIYPNANRPPPAKIAMMWKQVPEELREMMKLPAPIAAMDRETKLDEVGDWDVIRVSSLGVQ